MAKLLIELLLWIIRVIFLDLLWQVAVKFCAWLDTKIPGRWPRIIIGGFLGLAAYFALPILLGVLGL